MDDLVELLKPEDRLCIVSFNSGATRDCKLIRMNENGIKTVKETMKRLSSGGSTNIGSGIYHALKQITERKFKNPVTSVLLLGDG